MGKMSDRFLKSLLYRITDLAYAVLPKKSVLTLYCNLTNILKSITWKLACRYYGPDVIRYRGDIAAFLLSNVNKGDMVIDVGCAEGNLTSLVAAKARGVVGIDVDKKYIDNIDRKIREIGNVTFITGDIADMDFKETFDAAVLIHSIEHMPDSGKVLKKLSGMSRKIIIETPNADSDWISKLLTDLGVCDLGDDKHFELFNPRILKEVLEKNGWMDVDITASGGVVRGVAFSSIVKG